MPKVMTIVPVKEKPEKASEAEFQAVKRGGEITMPAVKAFEAIKLSKGCYRIKGASKTVVAGAMDLEDMDNSRLKLMAVNLGIRFQKKNISRKQLIALVRRKLDETVTVSDDEEVDTA